MILKYWDIVKEWVKDVDNWVYLDILFGIYVMVLEFD